MKLINVEKQLKENIVASVLGTVSVRLNAVIAGIFAPLQKVFATTFYVLNEFIRKYTSFCRDYIVLRESQIGF